MGKRTGLLKTQQIAWVPLLVVTIVNGIAISLLVQWAGHQPVTLQRTLLGIVVFSAVTIPITLWLLQRVTRSKPDSR